MSNKGGHTGSRIAKVSFLLRGSPWGNLIRLSCSGFHILPLSKLNHQHISSQRPAQKPACYTFLASSASNGTFRNAKSLPPPALCLGLGDNPGWACGGGREGDRARVAGFIHMWAESSPNGLCSRFLSFVQSLNGILPWSRQSSYWVFARKERLSAPSNPPTLKVL